ncbi:cell division cycle 14 [Cryptococcus neoformans c8]|nr:cell division cycle 14 [Cryptococcus neoformans var. grubii AD1-83a]OXG68764.1 cell division cycle 14 [Cryptococcus neoformans var. grubii c8]OXG69270.1 cell division cycle 14 [Cryptococcus neoformans var. grubii MW-RSA1955]OXG72804.1 cell division cycle 14 [Cryptococcus neoformans var. grubii CHC193]OXH18947.1 cell division cycle 14 [Cryptococcus neoformans var. grubii A5-35-17]OXH20446.1 cell division cycle 14 [Cryptococcus neoformans var. grubii A1-35-8]
MPSTSTRAFPNEVAVFSNYLLFTTLTFKEVQAHAKTPYGHPGNKRACSLFTLDDDMRYTSFAMDHGPLNLAFTFHACIRIHEKLEKARERGKPVCLYTTTEPKMKSNMILIAALYSLIVDKQPPWNAFRPIAQFEVMPFRDAGSGPMDYGLTVQDILYGVEKAIGNGLLDLASFDADEYQYYEMVENGDLNILGPFIPFASPTENSWIEGVLQSPPNGRILHTPVKSRTISHQLRCVLDIFERENVGLVARLNDELYDRRHFLDMGIEHIEMFFDDGTNPPDDIVREFIRLAEHTIEHKRQKVAVHCKAGLGRTGVLIGAYLVYKYQFTAQEAIGFMRIVRPGMVVGPQQQYMVLNQLKWAGWAARDQALKEIAQASCMESNPPIAPPMEIVIKPYAGQDIETSTHIPPITRSPKLRPRRSQSSSSLATISPRRGGDAVGQPRKTRQLVEPTTETEHEELRSSQSHLSPSNPLVVREVVLEAPADQKENGVNPSTVSPLGSIRGTKRSATRPSPGYEHSNSLPRVSLNVPSSSLTRANSNVSIGSEGSVDERPPKRRTGSSPPEVEESGATVSPVSEPMVAEQVETPVRLTATKNLRLRTHSSSPSPPPASTPSVPGTTPTRVNLAASTEAPSTPTRAPSRVIPENTNVIASVRRTMPAKKSFLPVRKNVESKSTPVRATTNPATAQSPPLSTRTSARVANTLNRYEDIAVNSNGNAKNVKAATPASRKLGRGVTKKGVLTPPRITEMWGQLSRIGSSPPADKEKQ